MRAPSDIRSSATSIEFKNMNEPMIVMRRTAPMSKPLRKPMKINSTNMTISTA